MLLKACVRIYAMKKILTQQTARSLACWTNTLLHGFRTTNSARCRFSAAVAGRIVFLRDRMISAIQHLSTTSNKSHGFSPQRMALSLTSIRQRYPGEVVELICKTRMRSRGQSDSKSPTETSNRHSTYASRRLAVFSMRVEETPCCCCTVHFSCTA